MEMRALKNCEDFTNELYRFLGKTYIEVTFYPDYTLEQPENKVCFSGLDNFLITYDFTDYNRALGYFLKVLEKDHLTLAFMCQTPFGGTRHES